MKLFVRCERCRTEAEPCNRGDKPYAIAGYYRLDPPEGWEYVDGWLLCLACKVLIRTVLDKAIRESAP